MDGRGLEWDECRLPAGLASTATLWNTEQTTFWNILLGKIPFPRGNCVSQSSPEKRNQ